MCFKIFGESSIQTLNLLTSAHSLTLAGACWQKNSKLISENHRGMYYCEKLLVFFGLKDTLLISPTAKISLSVTLSSDVVDVSNPDKKLVLVSFVELLLQRGLF